MSEQDTPSRLQAGRSSIWPPYARFGADALPVVSGAWACGLTGWRTAGT